MSIGGSGGGGAPTFPIGVVAFWAQQNATLTTGTTRFNCDSLTFASMTSITFSDHGAFYYTGSANGQLKHYDILAGLGAGDEIRLSTATGGDIAVLTITANNSSGVNPAFDVSVSTEAGTAILGGENVMFLVVKVP